MMIATTHKEKYSQKVRILLTAAVLVVVLLFLYSLTALGSQVFAGETEDNEAQQIMDLAQSSESTSYQVYEFDEQGIQYSQEYQNERNSTISISNLEVPLTSFAFVSQSTDSVGESSMFNLILATATVASLILMLVLFLVRETRDYRVIAIRTIAMAYGLMAIATCSLFDRFQRPLTFFNDASILMAILFGVYVIAAVGSYIYEARLRKQLAQQ